MFMETTKLIENMKICKYEYNNAKFIKRMYFKKQLNRQLDHFFKINIFELVYDLFTYINSLEKSCGIKYNTNKINGDINIGLITLSIDDVTVVVYNMNDKSFFINEEKYSYEVNNNTNNSIILNRWNNIIKPQLIPIFKQITLDIIEL